MKLTIIFLNILNLANFKPYQGRNDPDFGVMCHESEDGYAVFVPHPTDCTGNGAGVPVHSISFGPEVLQTV